jgi:integrase
VLPLLGSLKVREIRRRHVKGLLMSKRAARLRRKKGKPSEQEANSGYAKNTVRLIEAALSSVLTDDGYLETTNPAYSAGRKRRTAPAPVEVRPLSWEQRDALLAAAASDRRHHALFSVLAKAGLRPGEGMALRPGDLDFRNLSIRVERAATDGGRVRRGRRPTKVAPWR